MGRSRSQENLLRYVMIRNLNVCSETLNYSLITLITLVVFTLAIFGIDWVFSELVLRLFNAK